MVTKSRNSRKTPKKSFFDKDETIFSSVKIFDISNEDLIINSNQLIQQLFKGHRKKKRSTGQRGLENLHHQHQPRGRRRLVAEKGLTWQWFGKVASFPTKRAPHTKGELQIFCFAPSLLDGFIDHCAHIMIPNHGFFIRWFHRSLCAHKGSLTIVSSLDGFIDHYGHIMLPNLGFFIRWFIHYYAHIMLPNHSFFIRWFHKSLGAHNAP